MKQILQFRICVWIAVLVLCSGWTVVPAQSLSLVQYKREQGLPSNIVYTVISDGKGYLWMGTDKGLCRYNGRSFTIYTTEDGLPDNDVFSCKEDYSGRLWITTFKGKLCYLKDGVFHTEANTPWLKLPANTPHFYGEIMPQKDSSLILFSLPRLTFLNIRDDHIRIYDLSRLQGVDRDNVNLADCRSVRKLNSNRFRIYTNTHWLEVDSSLRLLSVREARYNIAFNRHGICLINDKGLWDDDAHPLSVTIRAPYDVSRTLYVMQRIGKDLAFIGGATGLYLNDQSLLQGKKIPITYIEKDIDGNIWVATRGQGIYKINRFFNNIYTLPGVYTEQVIYGRNINGITYFVNNDGQVYELNKNVVRKKILLGNGNKTELLRSNLIITDSAGILQLHGRRGNYVISSLTDPSPVKRTFTYYLPDQEPVLKGLCEDRGFLYLFSVYGIAKLDLTRTMRGDKALQQLLLTDPARAQDRIYARALDPETHYIWFSREDGLYRMGENGQQIQKQSSPFIFRQLECYGPYLVGITDNNKLAICNTADKSLHWDTMQQDKCIWEQIYPVDRQHALISTNNHYKLLTLLQPAANGAPRYQWHTVEDPFIPKQAEYVIADSAHTTFFKEGAITRVATSLLFSRPQPPIPVISSLIAARKPYPIRSQITIPYAESSNIRLLFDNISFASEDIIAQYSLSKEGRDDWQDISGNEININNPGFGDLIIKIRSKSLSSGYSQPAVLRLHILKPFWATWWFIILCIIVFIVLIWAIVQLLAWRKIRRQQKQHEADMKYQQSEYKALNALMNPHFIFNSLNNIQGLINKDEKRTANEYLVIFSDLVRQNMHNISKGFISLQQELNLIENYLNLEKLRFRELVNYEINVDEAVETEDIMIPPLMIQPLVENAVKHGLLPRQGPDNKVIISVYEREDKLYIEIEDNGVGLTFSQQSRNRLYESFGLTNLQKRTEHLKKIQQHEIDISVKELFDETGSPTGTKAIITIGI